MTWHRNWAVAYFQWSEVIVVMSPPVLLTAWWQCCESRGLSWLLLLDCGTEARVCVFWPVSVMWPPLLWGSGVWYLILISATFPHVWGGQWVPTHGRWQYETFFCCSLPRYPGFEQCWRSDPSRRPVRSQRLDFRDVLGFLTYFQLCYVKSPAGWLVSRLPLSLPRSPYR